MTVAIGWWNTNEEGHSLLPNARGTLVADPSGMVWGDGPADILDVALRDITQQFQAAIGRPPKPEEVIAGIKFALPPEGDGD